MAEKKDKTNKTTVKRVFKNLGKDFSAAAKDKKRWLVCLSELLISGILIAVDLLTKHFIYGRCKVEGDIILIKGVLRFTAKENTGAAFGVFGDSPSALTVVSIICSAILIFFIFYSYPRRNKFLRSALILTTAGALGNVADRLSFGYVRDMVYFELTDFAVFNFADSCLTVGTVLLLIYVIFVYNREEREKEAAEEAEKVKAKLALVRSEENSPEESTSAETADPGITPGEPKDGVGKTED